MLRLVPDFPTRLRPVMLSAQRGRAPGVIDPDYVFHREKMKSSLAFRAATSQRHLFFFLEGLSSSSDRNDQWDAPPGI